MPSSLLVTREHGGKLTRGADSQPRRDENAFVAWCNMANTTGFFFNQDHQIIICQACSTCVNPLSTALERHLRGSPHRLTGAVLKATLQQLSSYEARSAEDLKQNKPAVPAHGGRPIKRIEHLAAYRGWRCLAKPNCGYCTRVRKAMQKHVAAQHRSIARPRGGEGPAPWQQCTLQTYFTAKGLIDYFVVADDGGDSGDGDGDGDGDCSGGGGGNRSSSSREGERREDERNGPEREAFGILKDDIKAARQSLRAQGGVVRNPGDGPASEEVPWLQMTQFPHHLAGLADEDIRSSIALPSRRRRMPSGGDYDDDDGGDDADLVRVLAAADAVLQRAYRLCSDRTPESRMTYQRALVLSDFLGSMISRTGSAPASSSRSRGFRYMKRPSTLTSYFNTTKQLLAYYYRVVYREDGHFPRGSPDQRVPQSVIEQTAEQEAATREIEAALARLAATGGNHDNAGEGNSNNDDGGGEGGARREALQRAVRRLLLAFITQRVGSRPFRSTVLSFCAMLSRKKPASAAQGVVAGSRDEERMGVWEEPGNFNSRLSALIWVAQMLLFEHACDLSGDDDDRVLEILDGLCQSYLRIHAESAFGLMLGWRSYLFEVARHSVSRHQAVWSPDGQVVTYQGVSITLDQVTQLVRSEYQQAYDLLHSELLLGADNLDPLEAWRLTDDLDLGTFGGSWVTLAANSDVVAGAEHALLRTIWANATLREKFFLTNTAARGRNGNGQEEEKTILNTKAMAVYEAYVQEFLKHLLVLCHVAPAPPLRAPEILSATWRNTARRRHIFIWQKLVLLHVQYHKSQAQTGRYKENARFLPRAVGDLLLPYIAYVLPLRQLFLRQKAPDALISPYLWSDLDGTVWPDGSVTSCLRQACGRAGMPKLGVAAWRQFAATITKEKFAPGEAANFDIENGLEPEDPVEDEAELAALAEMSNHGYRTFNHAYAGTTTLTMTSLLHRGLRASESWRGLFRFDAVLLGKRPRAVSETESLRLLESVKRRTFRPRGAFAEAELLAAARRLYNAPKFRFRTPGQRAALTAVMGPGSASHEQVVLVLGTGSGKTLVAMVSAVLADEGTTVLVVPTIALRVNMMSRFQGFGIQLLVWSPECRQQQQAAPLVIISAEAVCTTGFLDYAHTLVHRQQLARIIIDEAHLTITASDYRRSMSQLGWYVRQVRAQTVWMTATLPPALYDLFVSQNKLVRPVVIRESTNRPNIYYAVRHVTKPGLLVEAAALLLQRPSRLGKISFVRERDKVIVYCRSRDEVARLADLVGCSSCTADSTEEERRAILDEWLASTEQPVIAATSALGPGFDHPHVRLVVHVDAPDRMTDFSQESGRAGRDGARAASVVLLSAAWEPQRGKTLSADQEAMQLYLAARHCHRGVLSQFLDAEKDWRWCMAGDEACRVCDEPHGQARPAGLAFSFPSPPPGDETAVATHTGPGEVLRQDQMNEEVFRRYRTDLEEMAGICLYCRTRALDFEHGPGSCRLKWDWIRAKSEALKIGRGKGRGWMEKYVACWKCYQPQDICRAADPDGDETACRFPDMVMPLCYGVFQRAGAERWLQKHFGVRFSKQIDYMRWLGETSTLGGRPCIQANRVAAVALAELG